MNGCNVCKRQDAFSEKINKCIFHCDKPEKDGWLTRDHENVIKFWEAVRNEKMAKNDFDFSRFIFPVFERKNTYLDLQNKKHKAKADFNFWEEDQKISFDGSIDSFRKSHGTGK